LFDCPFPPELGELSARVLHACSGIIHEEIDRTVEAEAEVARQRKAKEKESAELEQSVRGALAKGRGASRSGRNPAGIQKPRAGKRKALNCATAHKNNQLKKLRFDLYLKKVEELCKLRDELVQATEAYYTRTAGQSIHGDPNSSLAWAAPAC
jgi:hypothetical protein